MQELTKEVLILNLFDAYPSSGAQVSNSRIATYVDAVHSISIEAVRRSVEQYVTGKVDRENKDFVPSAEAFAANARDWQRAIEKRTAQEGPEMHNGLIEMDFGQGRIDMRGLTNAEQDQIIANKGLAPSGKSLAYLSLTEIREAISQKDLAQVEGGRSFSVPKLGRIAE